MNPATASTQTSAATANPAPDVLQLIECQQHRADRQHQQDAAGGIEALAVRGAGVGRQQPGQQERRQRQRHAEPEHRGPVDQRHQQTGDQRPQCAAEADHHGVDAEHAGARGLGMEAGRQRRSAAQHQCGADALQHARGQQCTVARGHRAQHEGDGAPQAAGEEDAPVAQHVADAAEHQHQRGIGERVGDHHPLDRRDRQSERARDERKGEIDRRIERHDQRAECHHQHAEAGSGGDRRGAAGQTAFFSDGDALKRTVLPAFTLIDSPVRGFSPLRALVFRTVKVPKLGSVNLPSFFKRLDDRVHQVAGGSIGGGTGQIGGVLEHLGDEGLGHLVSSLEQANALRIAAASQWS